MDAEIVIIFIEVFLCLWALGLISLICILPEIHTCGSIPFDTSIHSIRLRKKKFGDDGKGGESPPPHEICYAVSLRSDNSYML